MYTIPAIPTRYNGVNFRSRLEAKWAAFFDLLGWRWDYEPVDFPGWIPDFVIYGKRNPVYIEVKPFDLGTNDPYEHKSPDVAGILEKMLEATEGKVEMLLVGHGLFDKGQVEDLHYIGFIGEPNPEYKESEHGFGWTTCSMVKYEYEDKMGFCSDSFDYTDRITGQHKSYPRMSRDEWFHVVDLWKEAGNKVQWNPRPC